MMTNKTKILTTGGEAHSMVTDFLSGVVSPYYIVKMIHINRSYVISRHWNHDQVIENIPLMTEKNRNDFHIYIRPADERFILLDDLTRSNLEDLAKLKPCVLMETSPNNVSPRSPASCVVDLG